MQCNIDQRGRKVRFAWGLLMCAGAVALAVCGYLGVVAGAWVWIVVGLLAAAGLFGFYEARKGWCAVRAMGFKTPM
ncbi:MAG: hypothetical protein GC162_14710 [Planctomycetes bacterium]|nr:hypothetical protein [Planctomycetota bacterium]